MFKGFDNIALNDFFLFKLSSTTFERPHTQNLETTGAFGCQDFPRCLYAYKIFTKVDLSGTLLLFCTYLAFSEDVKLLIYFRYFLYSTAITSENNKNDPTLILDLAVQSTTKNSSTNVT